MKERMEKENQRTLNNDKLDGEDLALRPHWKIYLGVIWGLVCVGLFSMKPILGIIAPFLYVIYLLLDNTLDGCCRRALIKIKSLVSSSSNR